MITGVRWTELAVLISLAVVSDLRSCRIRNGAVVPFMLLGLATALFTGFGELLRCAAGLLLPVVLLLPLYALRMLGAGDIKLFCAIGAVMGMHFILPVLVYSFLAGGALALVLILVRRNAAARLKALGQYLRCCWLTLSLMPYTRSGNPSEGETFRFSLAIACGTLAGLLSTLFPAYGFL